MSSVITIRTSLMWCGGGGGEGYEGEKGKEDLWTNAR